MKKFLFIFISVALLFAAIFPVTVLAEPDEVPDTSWGENYSDETFWGMMGYETIDECMDSIMSWSWYGSSESLPFWKAWDSDSKEDFMELYDLDDEEYQVIENAWQRAWKKAQEEERLQYLQDIQELGGTPDIINVMYNGTFIKFTGAVPEKTSGLTFVPMKPFFEALGADVGYDAKTKMITAELKNLSVSFAAGRDTMSVTENETTRERPIDVAPYIKKGVSYIPVRAVAEALELDVYWDTYYKSVVIIDPELIEEEIDKDYTILNSLLNMAINSGQSSGATYKSVLNMLISITQFDSLDGDKLSKVAANIKTITDGRNMSMTGEIDISDLISLLLEEVLNYQNFDDEDNEMALFGKLKALKEIKTELIFNYDKGMFYFRAPILSLLSDKIPPDAWLSMSGLDEYSSDPGSILNEIGLEKFSDGITVGKIITSAIISNSSNDYSDQIYLYSELMDNAKAIAALIGDDNFKKNGGDYTLTLTTEDFVAALGETDLYSYNSPTELELKLTIKVKDDEILGISGKFVTRIETYNSDPVTRITCDFDIGREDVKLNLEVHMKNTLKVVAEINSKITVTSEPIPKAPPVGDKVIPMDDLLESDDDYWPDLVEQLSGNS